MRAIGRCKMRVIDENTINRIEKLRLTHLEAQIVEEIAARTGMDTAHALDLWYGSDLCESVERNDYGLQFLDAGYLADELLRSVAESDE